MGDLCRNWGHRLSSDHSIFRNLLPAFSCDGGHFHSPVFSTAQMRSDRAGFRHLKAHHHNTRFFPLIPTKKFFWHESKEKPRPTDTRAARPLCRLSIIGTHTRRAARRQMDTRLLCHGRRAHWARHQGEGIGKGRKAPVAPTMRRSMAVVVERKPPPYICDTTRPLHHMAATLFFFTWIKNQFP